MSEPVAGPASDPVPGQVPDPLAAVRHVVLDLDGTCYLGETLLPGVRELLDTLRDLGIGWTFITNNSSLSRDEYAAKLYRLGIAATPAAIHTSAIASIEYLRSALPGVHRVFMLGSSGLGAEYRAAGFEIHEVDDAAEPDAVVVGFDTGLTFESLCKAAYWISRGVPFIATHPDRVCPTDEPTVLVDCGSICAALTAATGRGPDAVLGKPDPRMLVDVFTRHQLQSPEVAMVGDRLYTDMQMARNAGVVGVLVLTGETTRAEAEAEKAAKGDRSFLIVEDLEELVRRLRDARSRAQC